MGEFREPNGGVSVTDEEEIPAPSPSPPLPSTFFLLSSSAVLSNPSVSDIGPERWAKAEKATQNIIRVVQPTSVSEDRRRAVIDYVQRLIGGCLGCEVLTFH